jgi:glutaminyl-tRNA synthetase
VHLPDVPYAHPIEDALENITHSICTLEFEDQRPWYDWLLDKLCELGLLAQPRPHQYEFARLNVTYVITSKRKLKALVDERSSPAGTIRACRRSPGCAGAATRPRRCA